MSIEADEDLMGLLQSSLKIQRETTESLIDQRGHTLAIELAVFAIAEQLIDAGLVNSRMAADRMIEIFGRMEPSRFLERVEPQITATANHIRDLGSKKGPRPPRGSKPRIVK